MIGGPDCAGCDRPREPLPNDPKGEWKSPVSPRWCWDGAIWAMRNRWNDTGILGQPRLIEMLCASNGWNPPTFGDVYTVTENGAQYEIRRVK